MRTAVALQGVDEPDEFEAKVAEIDRLGFDQLWLTDSSLHSRNCWAYLTLAARASGRLGLGTAVTNPVTRHPAVTAVAASTVAEISRGRLILGIGAGDRPLLSLGQSPAKLANLEASIGAIRALWTGEHVSVAAPGFALDDAHYRFPPAGEIPVYVSATGPKTLELAGRIADGVILLAGLHPEGIRFALEHIDRGVAAAGRSARPAISVFAYGAIDDDKAAAMAAARTIAAWFPQTSPVYCELAGLPRQVIDDVRNSYSGGEFQEAARAAQALPDDFVRRMALAGDAADARRHVRTLADLGVDEITVFPLARDRMATVRAFAQCVRDELGAAEPGWRVVLMRILGVHHVAFTELSGAATAALSDLFGLTPDHEESAAGFVERMTSVENCFLQALEPTGPGIVQRSIDTRGVGLHHLALQVDDVERWLEHLGGRGVRLIDTAARHGGAGTRIGFIHPQAAAGILIELVEAPAMPSPSALPDEPGVTR